MRDGAIALGWRVHSSSAVVVAVTGAAASPVVVHRETVALLDEASMREPYHEAAARPRDAPAIIRSVADAATAAAEALIHGFVASLGPVAAIGVVGGNRRLPTELAKILAKHALLHAAERALYEQAIIDGGARAGLPVTTVPATGALFDDASAVLGVELEPSLAALGGTVGRPWQKDHKEAAAAALLALHALA